MKIEAVTRQIYCWPWAVLDLPRHVDIGSFNEGCMRAWRTPGPTDTQSEWGEVGPLFDPTLSSASPSGRWPSMSHTAISQRTLSFLWPWPAPLPNGTYNINIMNCESISAVPAGVTGRSGLGVGPTGPPDGSPGSCPRPSLLYHTASRAGPACDHRSSA